MSTTLLDSDAEPTRARGRQRARSRGSRGARAARARGGEAPRRRAAVRCAGEPRAHTPVLAAELIELLDPHPGQIAIDCTFGGGGHARLVAERLGATGTLVAIDRDPLAEERFEELAARVACSMRFIRSGYAEALERARGGPARRPRLLRPRHVLDADRHARARLLLLLRRSPGHAHGPGAAAQRARARRRVGRAHASPACCASSARSATRGAIARAIVAPSRARPAREHPASSSTRSTRRYPRPRASPAAIPPSAPSRRCASPSTTSSRSSSARCRTPGSSCARAACSPRSPSTRSRTAASSASSSSSRAGCICPPELPVCVCGREAEAALLTRRAICPTRRGARTQPARRLRAPARRAQARRRAVSEPRGRPAGAARGASARAAAAHRHGRPRRVSVDRSAAAPASPGPRAGRRGRRAPRASARSGSQPTASVLRPPVALGGAASARHRCSTA